ncbi:MAG: hypothetical protein IT379_27045, partial [Deltaproteobacteria bacterium]|nr:hypothetical protein [Deltaproteobacteria bacterium]
MPSPHPLVGLAIAAAASACLVSACCCPPPSGRPSSGAADVASLEAYLAASRAALDHQTTATLATCREHRLLDAAELDAMDTHERTLIAATDRASRANPSGVWRKMFPVGRAASRLAEHLIPLGERCRTRAIDLAQAEREIAPRRAAY